MSESNSIPTILNFEHYRGNTFRRQFTVTQDSADYNLGSATVRFLLRKISSKTPVLTLDEGSGITIAGNVITVVVTVSQLESLGSPSKLDYELQVNEGSDVTTWLSGEVRFIS